MKINVQVDLTEFYSEEEGQSFSEEIKSHIAFDVKSQVLELWRKDLKDVMAKQILEDIASKKDELISSLTEEFFETKTIELHRFGGRKMTLQETVVAEFEKYLDSENSYHSKIVNQVEHRAASISHTLQERYDLQFASQLISKMDKIGILKKDVAQNLLTQDGE